MKMAKPMRRIGAASRWKLLWMQPKLSLKNRPQTGGLPDLIASAGIFIAGLLLWALCRYREAALPSWAPWDFSISWFLASAFALWWYLRGLKAAAPPPPRWRTVLFLLGLVAIYGVLQTRFEYLAEHMFFLNRVQHVVMHHLGPFLIALAWPWQTILDGMPKRLRDLAVSATVRRFLTIMRQPFLAAVLFVGLIGLWLVPSIHFRAMIDPKLYLVMNWSMVGDGLLFWSLVLDPRDRSEAGVSFGIRAALPIAIMLPQILLGALLTFSRTDLYAFYEWCGRLYPSVSALDDQHYGGLIVWISAGDDERPVAASGPQCAAPRRGEWRPGAGRAWVHVVRLDRPRLGLARFVEEPVQIGGDAADVGARRGKRIDEKARLALLVEDIQHGAVADLGRFAFAGGRDRIGDPVPPRERRKSTRAAPNGVELGIEGGCVAAQDGFAVSRRVYGHEHHPDLVGAPAENRKHLPDVLRASARDASGR